MSESGAKVRLLFVDDGDYREEIVEVPADALERHERLIDVLLEDPDVQRRVHVDPERLVAAFLD